MKKDTLYCRHCKKEITHAKINGLSIICPHCNRPTNEIFFASTVYRDYVRKAPDNERIILFMQEHEKKNGSWPGLDDISKGLDMPDKPLKALLRLLVESGLISRTTIQGTVTYEVT